MSISDIINGTGAASGAAQGSGIKKKDQLGQAEVLELMIAAVNNPDAFRAMDPSQFLGQLAQFGTVTGIQEMQSAFGTLSDAMRSSQVLDGSTMVGREVLGASQDATLQAEGSVHGAFDVPSGATGLTLNIRDANGTLVRHTARPAGTGLQEFSWEATA